MKVKCPQPGLKTGLLDPKTRALTMKPLPTNYVLIKTRKVLGNAHTT